MSRNVAVWVGLRLPAAAVVEAASANRIELHQSYMLTACSSRVGIQQQMVAWLAREPLG
jgi:hypothetical protein